jgi:hypothetical protein
VAGPMRLISFKAVLTDDARAALPEAGIYFRSAIGRGVPPGPIDAPQRYYVYVGASSAEDAVRRVSDALEPFGPFLEVTAESRDDRAAPNAAAT